MAFIFFVNSMVYYGLSLNVGSLGGSIYLNNFLSGLVEMPSYAFAQYAVEAMGRQRTLVLLLAIASVGCLISGFAQVRRNPSVVPPSGKFSLRAKLTNQLKTGHSEDRCRSRGSIRNRGIIQHDIPVYYGIVSNSCA